jgi:hypothetical protein
VTDQLGRRLVRSLNGVRVHTATCRWARAGHVRPWAWAETVPWKTVVAEVQGLGLRPCKECNPLEDR